MAMIAHNIDSILLFIPNLKSSDLGGDDWRIKLAESINEALKSHGENIFNLV